MVKEKAISMEPVREKLRNLGSLIKSDIPYIKEFCGDFGNYLAGRIENHPQLVPSGLNLAFELALHDLQTGIDGYSKKPIDPTYNRLVKQPPIVYTSLRLMIPEIVEATCPKEFANEVKRIRKEIMKSRNKSDN